MKKIYYCGSVYKKVKRPSDSELIIIAAGEKLGGHYMISVAKKHYLVSDGELYVWQGKQKGFKSPWR